VSDRWVVVGAASLRAAVVVYAMQGGYVAVQRCSMRT